jgi:hypothetical protein
MSSSWRTSFAAWRFVIHMTKPEIAGIALFS